MKKIIIFLAFVLLAASYGNATPGAIYFGVQGGYEHSDHNIGNWAQSLSYDTNFTVWGLSLGADINSSLRTELAYSHKNAKEDIFDFRSEFGELMPEDIKEKITQQTLLINIFFYLLKNTRIQPFIGAGAGIGWVEVEHLNNYQKFAYAGYLGVDYRLTEHLVVNLMGTYNSTGSYKYFSHNKNWGATVGARYYF